MIKKLALNSEKVKLTLIIDDITLCEATNAKLEALLDIWRGLLGLEISQISNRTGRSPLHFYLLA